MLVILIGWELWNGSSLAIKKFGFHFLTTSTWDPVAEQFGALPFIYGTLVSSAIALIIAVPLGIATAAYLTELAPLWIRQPLISLIEMLAAIPSVILGLWGVFVMVPWLRDYPFPFLKHYFGWIPLFTGPIYGPCMFAGGIIIAIMILPIITSISREILRSVPNLQREAAYALGATRWEATRIAVLSYAKKGLFGAVILGLGRALGETLAVTMVIGNTPQIVASLFKPGYTLASVLANEFTEATTDIYLQALFEIGLVLFGITILVNLLAQAAAANYRGQRQQHARCNSHAFQKNRQPYLAQNQKRAGIGKRLYFRYSCDPAHWVWCSFTCSLTGSTSVNWDFFTKLPAPVGEVGGGMANAIVGSLELLAIAGVIGIPIGVLGGVYLAEYGSARINSVLRFLADVLNGIPSITWGVVVYGLVVLRFKSFSALAGGLALGLIMIPLILRTTEEVVLLVPNGYREAALALGVSRWKTIVHIVMKTASKGIITGILLALARIGGETAPLLFTAFGNRFWNHSLTQPIAALPLQIFTYAISPYDDWHRQAWAGALVLVTGIFFVNITVRILTRGRGASVA